MLYSFPISPFLTMLVARGRISTEPAPREFRHSRRGASPAAVPALHTRVFHIELSSLAAASFCFSNALSMRISSVLTIVFSVNAANILSCRQVFVHILIVRCFLFIV